ncbi:MAG: UDP-N-acetylglucosamine 1-carboxyvinyltransferase [Clostridia bacterium]|nr:UDP-N-acetylglucosamine 1-carboxyvinyltransferase [Clostridia bacterium]
MDKFVINGGSRLVGEVTISGAKNAAVAIIPAAILCDGICRIENVPQISDVTNCLRILYEMGASVKTIDAHTVEIDSHSIHSHIVPHEIAKRMRASYYLIGALLGKFNKASVAMPGGCDLGPRPIDQHLKGFEALGAKIALKDGMISVEADRLLGNQIYLDVVSVGATINIMIAAAKARGLTIIENAAKEPHIVDLANFLNSMGADIRGAGTDVIKIRGVESLRGTTYSIIPDQIEAGTFMVAAAATGGDVLINNVIPKHLESISNKLIEAGAEVIEYDEAVRVRANGRLQKCVVKTMPHPGFPTDMQPQIGTMLAVAEGTSVVSEGIWDNRFRYTEQLARMGADIQVNGKVAVIQGVSKLKGAPVRANDLRAGAAMLIAGCMAEGVTEIEDIHYIERGYENVVEKFRSLGADIKRITVPSSISKVV